MGIPIFPTHPSPFQRKSYSAFRGWVSPSETSLEMNRTWNGVNGHTTAHGMDKASGQSKGHKCKMNGMPRRLLVMLSFPTHSGQGATYKHEATPVTWG